MATKIIKAWIDGAIQEIEVEEMNSPEQPLSYEERLDVLEDKPIITDGNLLVGNGTQELEEMTPEEVLSHINGASVTTMTTEEYEALGDEESNANTLYVLTDSEEEEYTRIYTQSDEPVDAPDGSLWVDLDEISATPDATITITQSVFYYTSLSDAVNAANNDDFRSAMSSAEAKVAVTRFGSENYRIDLLNDVSETVGITISTNVYLSLNGKTLSFTNSGDSLVFSEGISCVIDGEITGSAITKNTLSLVNSDLIKTYAKYLKVLGGEYSSIDNSTTKQNFVFRCGDNDIRPDGYADMNADERLHWLVSHKNTIPNLELLNCTVKSSGGSACLGILCDTAHLVCRNSVFEVSESVYSMCIRTQFACADIEKCQMSNSNNGGKQSLLEVSMGGHAFIRDCSFNAAISGNVNYIIGIRVSQHTSGELINNNVIINHSGKQVSSGVYALYNDGKVEARDSGFFAYSYCTDKIVSGYYAPNVCASLTNCNLEGISSAFDTWGGEHFLTRCNLRGYLTAINLTNSAKLSMKDSDISAGANFENYASQLSGVNPICCAKFNGNSIKLDSCSIDAGSNVPIIFDVTASTLDASNCSVHREGSQLIKLRDNSSQLNVGCGCNITDDMISNTSGSVSYTNELYRHLEDSEQCSGKDLKVYHDYLIKSIAGQLSSIVDGETG